MSVSFSVKGGVPSYDPLSLFPGFCWSTPYMALVIIPTVRSKGHLQMCSVSFQSHLAAFWPSSQEKGRFGVASMAFCFGSVSTQSCPFHLSFSTHKVVKRVFGRATTDLQPVSSEMVSRPSCVCAQGGQINISEKQYELNHFLNKTRPHASS